ncbi:cupin [Advenella kashmirensis W13003]|uniref:Cupin n=2 Tax=Advenella kashmirensis TaxID=310575 RepID=V8QSK1_9BURK|nr:cupin [Advenella kashmirensis W13003]
MNISSFSPSDSNHSDEPVRLLLSETLIALNPGAAIACVPPHERSRVKAEWIVGIKAFSDQASVHGNHWERHPHGDEVLTVLEGELRIVPGIGAAGADKADPNPYAIDAHPDKSWRLASGESAIVPQGCWHRLEVLQPGRLMFITPATDSEHQLRRHNTILSENA